MNDSTPSSNKLYWKRRDEQEETRPESSVTFLVLAGLAIFVGGIMFVPTQIERTVNDAVIDTLNNLGLGALSVRTEGQDVFIAGALPSHQLGTEIPKLQAIARGVTCDVAVLGEVICPAKVFLSIEEEPIPPKDDSAITDRPEDTSAQQKLASAKPNEPESSPPKFHNFDIEKEEDFITINGEMPNARVRDLMLRRGTKFGRAVIDDMSISERPAAEYFAWAVERAWTIVQYLEKGQVSWHRGQFSVKGQITSDLAETAEKAYESEFFKQRLAGINLDVRPVYNDVETCNRAFSDVLSNSAIEFAPESARILAVSGSVLDRVAVLAEQCTLSFTVESHVAASDSSERDLTLSQQRADAVLNALSERGIDETRLTAKGFGGTNPIKNNNTPLARMLNRRINIVATQ